MRRIASSEPVVYMIFDLLWLDGHSLLELPYEERRQLLAKLGLGGPLAGARPPRRRRRRDAGGVDARRAWRGSWPSGSTAPTSPGAARRAG